MLLRVSAKKPVTKKVPKPATVAEAAAAARAAVTETAVTVTVTEPIEIKETNDANAWEAKALKTIDDPDFNYSDADPDAKQWDAAFESLRVRGFMNIVQDPKNPNDSLFVMTLKGREALAKLS